MRDRTNLGFLIPGFDSLWHEMAYRRTENMARRLAGRKAAIMAAAQAVVGEGGAMRIAPIAARAGVAAGTVYRYFPSKEALVNALIIGAREHELQLARAAAERAPGPLSALTAAIATFAARALQDRHHLAWAMFSESTEAETDAKRRGFRQAIAAEFAARIVAAVAAGRLPPQDAALAAHILVGALEGLFHAPPARLDDARVAAREFALLALRALGVADAHARGLVAQIAFSPQTESAA